VAPGPAPAGPGDDPTLVAGLDETLSYLCGDYRLFQPKAGHRWSLDDLVTAWCAVEEVPAGHAGLDLGTGLGSVLSLVAWASGSAFIGVEAQASRADMARRSLRYNGLDRCQVIDGDLRDTSLFAAGTTFDLITGTPPYFPDGSGPQSEKMHAGPCRFEHRGGIEAYVEAAARWLSPSGVFVVCAASLERARTQAALEASGLFVRRHVEVVPKEGKNSLVTVDITSRLQPSAIRHETLVVRDANNQWTQAFRQVRRRFGMPMEPYSTG
jgi:tRNA1Val (adenine37-N6)-methyltransferase